MSKLKSSAFMVDTKHVALVAKNALHNNVRLRLPTDLDDYAVYGVDNEFDYIESLYFDWLEYSPQLILTPMFAERRITCALNPEFTQKCLNSVAFSDVRDDILRRLENA